MAEHPYHIVEKPVPPIRHDISLIPVKHQDEKYVLFHDPMGYAPPDIALSAEIAPLLQLFDGRNSLAKLHRTHFAKSQTTISDLMSLITMLDQNRLLHSGYFKDFAEQTEHEFEQNQNRDPASVHVCYPDSPEAVRGLFDPHFHSFNGARDDIKALYAPHIDFRVGLDTYAAGFSRIRHLKPERVVILGTSHYSGYYGTYYDNLPFILSNKTFQTPLGDLKTDPQAYELLSMETGIKTGISISDRAHRIEHSIELHAVMCRYIWSHDFSIVPVLCGSLEEFLLFPSGRQGMQLERTASLIRRLDDGSTFFLISGDQAHFGRKFGDRFDAETRFTEADEFDEKYLNYSCEGSLNGISRMMRDKSDEFRICGYPPLALFLSVFPQAKGRLYDRSLWDEKEQKSAVSYASVGFEW